MKKVIFALFFNVFAFSVYSQLFPESFSYQAVLRDDESNILSYAPIIVRFTIQQDYLGQLNDVYTETHITNTNEYGLFNLSLGTGVPGNDNILNFDEIIWNWGYQLKVEIDQGFGFIDLGIEPMNAVPYSMYAKGNWGLVGNTGTNSITHFIGTTDDQNLNFRTNNELKMTLTTNGRLGIGTDNPSTLVELYSTESILSVIKLGHYQQAESGLLGLVSENLILQNNCENGQIELTTGEAEMHLDPDGNVGIGTSFPSAKLHVVDGTDVALGTANSGFLMLGQSGAMNITIDNNEIISRNYNQAATLFLNTEGGAVVVNQNTTPPYDFYVNGTAAKPGGGSWASYSDANLKHDIKSFDVGLETLLKVNPVNFKYIPEFAPDAETEYVGIIAQDLQKIAPFMVQSAPTVFEDGHSEEYLSVDPSAFTYMLINAVQELNAQNEALKKQIEIQATNQEFLINEIINLKSLIESK